MSINKADALSLEKILDNIAERLKENEELFNCENMIEFDSEREGLIKRIEQSEDEGRLLQIGIIGSVKAGKSSFLNVLLFDGEEILPKAATPMTAALTKISYSESPKAIIHFYEQADWQKIVELSDKYDSTLNNEYEKYEAKYNEQCRKIDEYNVLKRDIIGEPKKEKPPFKTKDEFEKTKFRRNVSELLSSSKELTSMLTSDSLLTNLGSSIEVTGDVNEYIGAKGKFTPIVNYVELFINDERLKDYIIVDTPGLNDPIVSRGNITKRFLADCDVAVLLSPTSQFMDEQTMNLMINSLPNAGVNEIMIVGSKVDSGLLDHPSDMISIQKAYKDQIGKYNRQLETNRQSLSSSNPIGAKKLENINAIYISSMFYSISNKKNANVDLNEEEEQIYSQCKQRFSDFEDKYLAPISGIINVKKELNGILEKKEKIINTKNEELLQIIRSRISSILNNISSNANSAREKLKNNQMDDELSISYECLNELLESSRLRLTSVFRIAASDAQKSAIATKAHIQQEIANYTRIKTDTEITNSRTSEKTGFLKLRTEYYNVETITKISSTSDVKNNIQSYIGKCISIIDEDFNFMIDKTKLSDKVKDVVISAMKKSGKDYNEDDVLLPLNATLAKISIPQVIVSANEYIDMINTAFPEGVAKGNDIHKLNSLQSDILNTAFDDISKSIDKCMQKISQTLDDQANNFTDRIIKQLQNEFDRISKQMKEKELYIQRYSEFLASLTDCRKMLVK